MTITPAPGASAMRFTSRIGRTTGAWTNVSRIVIIRYSVPSPALRQPPDGEPGPAEDLVLRSDATIDPAITARITSNDTTTGIW